MTKEADCGGWRVVCRCAQNTLSDVVGFGPGEKRVVDPELPREVDGPHLAAADRPRRRYLKPIIAVLPLLGHQECFLFLSWCPRKFALSLPWYFSCLVAENHADGRRPCLFHS